MINKYFLERWSNPMKENLFKVMYRDDRNKKHLTFVRTLKEVYFIRDRFLEVNYELISQENDLTPIVY
mgnify:CR=1 FL=1